MKTDKELIKHLNQLTRQFPYLGKFNERKYSNPKGYAEYESVMFSLARLLTSYQFYEVEYFKRDFTHRTSAITINQAYQKGFSPYWIKDELFDAFIKTQPPSKLMEFKRIVPCGVILFPNKLKSPDGLYLKWICFYHREAGERILPIIFNNVTLAIETVNQSTLSWFTILEDGTQYAINRKIEIENNSFSYETENLYIEPQLRDFNKNVDIETETTFTQKVTDLLIQTLLYLQLKPDSVENSIQSTGNKSVKMSKNTRLSPNIIGDNYRIKTEKQIVSTISNSNRQSPVTHWRRGFYKWQHYGSKVEEKHKLIWIEPVLVNG